MPDQARLHVAGLSWREAGIGVRERAASLQADALLRGDASTRRPGFLLATCNRLELYWLGDDAPATRLAAELHALGIGASATLMHRDGLDAFRHLVRVAAGLDSQVLGESEILGQLRRAWEGSQAAGESDAELDLMVQSALCAGRRVRGETFLGRHPRSVSDVGVARAAAHWPEGLAGKRALLLGAGEAARGALTALRAHGAETTVLARSPERAALMAGDGVSVAPLAALPSWLDGADLLVAATAAPEPIVTRAQVEAALASRGAGPLVVLDLCVPRNVEPEVGVLPGVILHDLDGLREQHCPWARVGGAALTDAERIVEEELARGLTRLRARRRADTLTSLHRLGECLADEEATRLLTELGVEGEDATQAVRTMTRRLAKRLLFPVSRELRR